MTILVGFHCRLRHLRFGAIIVAIIVWLASNVFAEPIESPNFNPAFYSHLPPEQVALIKEFFDASIALKRFYGNVTLSVSHEALEVPRNVTDGVSSLSDRPIKRRGAHELTYMVREGKYFRLDSTSTDPPTEGTSRNSFVQIIRPEQAYELGIDSATQRHFLIGHGMNVEDQWALLMSNQFPIAPFAYRVVELGNFFFLVTPQATKPYLRIDSVALQAAADSDSPEAIAVITTASTRFELLRNRRWAVHRISSRSEEADEKGVLITEWRQACEYAGDSDGFPLLKSVTYEVFSNRGAGEELNPLERDVFQVTQLVAEPPPMESFDVEMILGRKRVVTQEGGDRLWWVLVLNGLVLFVIGGYMLRRQRRQHGQPSGPGSAASPPQ